MSLSKKTFGSTFNRSTIYPGATSYRVEVEDWISTNTPNDVVRVVSTKGAIKALLHRGGAYTGMVVGTYDRKDGYTVEGVLRDTARRYGTWAD